MEQNVKVFKDGVTKLIPIHQVPSYKLNGWTVLDNSANFDYTKSAFDSKVSFASKK